MMARMGGSEDLERSEDVGTAPPETDLSVARRARTYRRALLAVLVAFVLAGSAGLLGARTASVSASGGGYELTVFYPAITRPGLAIRWIVVVEKKGGFDRPIDLATTSTYFNLFDFNNLDPTPTELTTTGNLSIWTFDPPVGETFRVTMDARLEPARQHGSKATTAVMAGGVTQVSVSYQTRVMP
jgi:hypothetical protein